MAPMLGVDWVRSGWLVRIGQSLGVARRKRHEVSCRHESRAAARRSSSGELGTSGCFRRPFRPDTNARQGVVSRRPCPHFFLPRVTAAFVPHLGQLRGARSSPLPL